MIYLHAFLLGGGLCGLFQLLWMTTKASPLTLLKTGFALAAVLASLGITGKLIEFADAGFFVMVVGAGDATFNGTIALFNGNAKPLLEFIAVIMTLIFLGLIGGYLAPVSLKKEKR